jgi:hypothetical protein
MSSFTQLPALMNVRVKAGDAASTSVDFDVSLSAYTVTSQVVSLVGGAHVASVATTMVNASAGQVSLAFPSSVPAGTYGWNMTWTSSDGSRRTVLAGIAEYVR